MVLNLQQGFPNVSAPVVDSRGFIQQSWLQLLISLWNRTGSSSGANLFSPGDYKETAVAGSQSGWLECDGSAVSRNTFANLFGAIGTTYGIGDGSTTFNLPDCGGKFRIGTNTDFPLGTSGGDATQTLSVPNLPPHSHVVDDPEHTHVFVGDPHDHTITDPEHLHPSVEEDSSNTIGTDPGSVVSGNTGTAATGITIDNTTATGTNSSSATGITLQNTGSGTSFSILPPYIPVTVLIKT